LLREFKALNSAPSTAKKKRKKKRKKERCISLAAREKGNKGVLTEVEVVLKTECQHRSMEPCSLLPKVHCRHSSFISWRQMWFGRCDADQVAFM
jgi:hypothetical protein